MTMPTMKAELRSTGRKSVELLIHDVIGRTTDGRGVDSEGIAKALADAGDVSTINVRINSAGGGAHHGIAIFNLLKEHPARVTVRIDGLAASAASLIAMAGDNIEMPASSLIAIHNPFAVVTGDADQLRASASSLDQVKSSAVEIYREKTGQKAEEISAWMTAETWFTAEEALSAGFATKIVSEPAASACLDLSAFHNAPSCASAIALPIEAPEMLAPAPAAPAFDPGPGRLAVADIDRFCEAFGPVNGLQWLREGRDFIECLTSEAARMRNELETLDDRHAIELKAEREKAAEARRQFKPFNPGESESVAPAAMERHQPRGLESFIRFADSPA